MAISNQLNQLNIRLSLEKGEETKNMTKKFTGNPIVDRLADLDFKGNLIPDVWYYTIVNDKHKPNMNAIMILAEIVYWYRPIIEVDESTNTITYKTKFKDKDFIQKSYQQFMDKFNLSRDQVHNALSFLEKHGLIKRHFRNIHSSVGILSNVMFIELMPGELIFITFPFGVKRRENENTSEKISTEDMENTHVGIGKNSKTTTKTTTTSIADQNCSPAVVDEAKEVFSSLSLSDKDILSIVRASGNDIEKCKSAMTVLNQQTKVISNITGWLINAVKNNYQPISKKPDTKKNGFNDVNHREYDFDDLERILLTTSI